MYVVFGIFPGGEARPVERLVVMKSTEHLLWRLWWEWVRLRGMRYIFSLKGVKGLGLYEVCLFPFFIGIKTDKK